MSPFNVDTDTGSPALIVIVSITPVPAKHAHQVHPVLLKFSPENDDNSFLTYLFLLTAEIFDLTDSRIVIPFNADMGISFMGLISFISWGTCEYSGAHGRYRLETQMVLLQRQRS